MRGFLPAEQAKFGYSTRLIIHTEINSIESSVMEVANAGYREVSIDSTLVTDSNVFAAMDVFEVDLINNEIDCIDHGLVTGDTVQFYSSDTLPSPLIANTLYNIERVNDDSFRLYASVLTTSEYIELDSIGSGNITARKVIESEKYYRAWQQFYIFPFAETYLGVLSEVEKHFRGLGYDIRRIS